MYRKAFHKWGCLPWIQTPLNANSHDNFPPKKDIFCQGDLNSWFPTTDIHMLAVKIHVMSTKLCVLSSIISNFKNQQKLPWFMNLWALLTSPVPQMDISSTYHRIIVVMLTSIINAFHKYATRPKCLLQVALVSLQAELQQTWLWIIQRSTLSK